MKLFILLALTLLLFDCGKKSTPLPRPTQPPVVEPTPLASPVATPIATPVTSPPPIGLATPFPTPAVDVESYIPPVASIAAILFASVLLMGLAVRREVARD